MTTTNTAAQALDAWNPIETAAQAQHPDDAAVEKLAESMKQKLAEKRAQGRSGWDTDCTQQRLSDLLRQHVEKGDVLDVANFCAFLFARGERVSAAQAATAKQSPHPEYDKGFSDGWNRCEARQAAAPVKRTVWVNLYGRQLESVCHPTEEDADKHASPNRIGGKAYPLEIEEGAQAVPAVPAIGQTDFDAVAPTQAGEYPAGTGNPEADRIICRLASSDPDFDDCADAVALIHKLVAEIKGPDGFATWKDAAIADRAARGAAQAAPVDAERWLDLLAEARAALWQPANAALCERLDAFIDAARAAQKGNHD